MHLNKNDLVVSVMLVIVLVICFGDGLAIRYSRHLEFKAEMSSEHGFHRSTSGFRFKNYIFREQEARSNTTDTPVTTYNTTTYKTTTYASSVTTLIAVEQQSSMSNNTGIPNATLVTVISALLTTGLVIIGSSLGISVSHQIKKMNQIQRQETIQKVNQFLISGTFLSAPVPLNDLSIPVIGSDLPNDGCGDGSVRFSDGLCYPVLKRGPCRHINYWITVDPVSLRGRCTPRLCGRGRVFVGLDGLCHDVYDTIACKGGRRLYYSAYGDPICDCPIGQYPFPNKTNHCVPLFKQGPCPDGNIVTLDKTDRLTCAPRTCPLARSPGTRRIGSFESIRTNTTCLKFGLNVKCLAASQLLGYNVFQRRADCVNVNDVSSPYFYSPDENASVTQTFNQLTAEYDEYHISLVTHSQHQKYMQNQYVGWSDQIEDKQDSDTFGILQVSTSLPDVLLNPCRPGARKEFNYKCTNPLLLEINNKPLLPAVSSAFRCPSEALLQATGQCVTSPKSLTCGPSYRPNQTTGQCRSIFT